MANTADQGRLPVPPDGRRRHLVMASLVLLLVLAGLVAYIVYPHPLESSSQEAKEAIERLGCNVGLLAGEAEIYGCADMSDDKFGQVVGHAKAFTSVLLDLTKTRVSPEGLKYLTELNNVKVLKLQGLRLTNDSLSALSGLQSLEHLDLSRTGIDDKGLPHLQQLVNLRLLILEENQGIIGTGLGSLSELFELQDLRLSMTRVDGDNLLHLKGLKSLKKLRLSGTLVDDAGLLHLTGIKTLETLWILDVPGVTPAGVKALESMRPDLDVRRA